MKKQNKKKINKELQKLIDLINEDNINILDCTGLNYEYGTREENYNGDKLVYNTGKINIRINLLLFKDFTNKMKEKKIIYGKSKKRSKNI